MSSRGYFRYICRSFQRIFLGNESCKLAASHTAGVTQIVPSCYCLKSLGGSLLQMWLFLMIALSRYQVVIGFASVTFQKSPTPALKGVGLWSKCDLVFSVTYCDVICCGCYWDRNGMI